MYALKSGVTEHINCLSKVNPCVALLFVSNCLGFAIVTVKHTGGRYVKPADILHEQPSPQSYPRPSK